MPSLQCGEYSAQLRKGAVIVWILHEQTQSPGAPTHRIRTNKLNFPPDWLCFAKPEPPPKNRPETVVALFRKNALPAPTNEIEVRTNEPTNYPKMGFAVFRKTRHSATTTEIEARTNEPTNRPEMGFALFRKTQFPPRSPLR